MTSKQTRVGRVRSLAIPNNDRENPSALSAADGIERLRATPTDFHEPVLAEEIVSAFSSRGEGVLIDATLGGGGHSARLLRAYPAMRILGIDRDREARTVATQRLTEFAPRVRVVAGTFGELTAILSENQDFVDGSLVVGVLMDLGVSSHQLDEFRRGFSFRGEGPLDMRMNPEVGQSAAEYLAHVSEGELVALLRENGEGRFAPAIARALLQQLPQTTTELVNVVDAVVPHAVRRRGNVATRVFQALRIAVNDEVAQLESGLRGAMDALDAGGLLVVISYHSGEDRTVKEFMKSEASGGCTCPPQLPCVCGAVSRAIVWRASAQLARDEEISHNPRARSARLRIAEKAVA